MGLQGAVRTVVHYCLPKTLEGFTQVLYVIDPPPPLSGAHMPSAIASHEVAACRA